MHKNSGGSCVQVEADRTAAADTHHIEQAMANELAAKARTKGVPDDVAD